MRWVPRQGTNGEIRGSKWAGPPLAGKFIQPLISLITSITSTGLESGRPLLEQESIAKPVLGKVGQQPFWNLMSFYFILYTCLAAAPE